MGRELGGRPEACGTVWRGGLYSFYLNRLAAGSRLVDERLAPPRSVAPMTASGRL